MAGFSSDHSCEIRLPTYKRPAWLKEAIESLIKQTHQHWKAVVLDDDPARSGKDVVDALGDSRIHYLPTAGTRGAAENLSRAFRKERYHEETIYFSVLEDDNWLMPNYLSESIRLIREKQVNLLHINQECWWRPRTGSPYPMAGTTLETVLPGGELTPEYLHAGIFFFQGISNGSLFWTRDLHCELSASMHASRDAYVQEMLRCLAITEPSYCSHTCLSIWTDSERETKHRVFESVDQTDAVASAIQQSAFKELKAKNLTELIEMVFRYHSKMRGIDPIQWNRQLVHAVGLDLASTSYGWLLLQYPKQTAGYIARKISRKFFK